MWHSFHPEMMGRELDEEGELRVSCAELLLKPVKGARSLKYEFDKKTSSKGGSFANGGRQQAWEVSVGLLWTVNHLVEVDAPLVASSPSSSAASPKFVAANLESRSFTFDFKRAEAEIARFMTRLGSKPTMYRLRYSSTMQCCSVAH